MEWSCYDWSPCFPFFLFDVCESEQGKRNPVSCGEHDQQERCGSAVKAQ